MKFSHFFLLTILSIVLFSNCESEPKKEVAKEDVKTEPKEPIPNNETYPIENKSFQGISIGDKFSEKLTVLSKEIMETGEGDFVTYEIKNKQGEMLAYVMPDPRDPLVVGDITIVSPNAVTKDGVKVGMTLGELKKRLGNITVHGSEIESRTSVAKDNMRYRLDAAFGTYEVDQSQVSDTIKVLEITIF